MCRIKWFRIILVVGAEHVGLIYLHFLSLIFQNSYNDNSTFLEVESCCCKESECYHPTIRIPMTETVVHKTGKSSLQRTLVIVIGVALGILVVGMYP